MQYLRIKLQNFNLGANLTLIYILYKQIIIMEINQSLFMTPPPQKTYYEERGGGVFIIIIIKQNFWGILIPV